MFDCTEALLEINPAADPFASSHMRTKFKATVELFNDTKINLDDEEKILYLHLGKWSDNDYGMPGSYASHYGLLLRFSTEAGGYERTGLLRFRCQ